MKANYEDRARFYLMRRTPVIVRVDGKAFHSFTRGFDKPFDMAFIAAMRSAALRVLKEASGAQAAYVQSDEASFLLTDYQTVDTQAWFDYNKAKVESVAASVMTAAFNDDIRSEKGNSVKSLAFFDARAFNLPREEVVNYFLWRARDWARNSLSMYCQAFFSHKELQGKNAEQQHEMLHGIGKNWATDNPAMVKNGTFIVRATGGPTQPFVEREHITPEYATIDNTLHDVIFPPEAEK